MNAHVICVNDSVEAVYLGDILDATVAKEKLAEAQCERNKWSFCDPVTNQPSYGFYRDICYWHIHTTPVINH